MHRLIRIILFCLATLFSGCGEARSVEDAQRREIRRLQDELAEKNSHIAKLERKLDETENRTAHRPSGILGWIFYWVILPVIVVSLLAFVAWPVVYLCVNSTDDIQVRRMVAAGIPFICLVLYESSRTGAEIQTTVVNLKNMPPLVGVLIGAITGPALLEWCERAVKLGHHLAISGLIMALSTVLSFLIFLILAGALLKMAPTLVSLVLFSGAYVMYKGTPTLRKPTFPQPAFSQPTPPPQTPPQR